MGETGVLGILKGDKPSDKVLLLRADIDALPINEVGDVEYISKNPGVMHMMHILPVCLPQPRSYPKRKVK